MSTSGGDDSRKAIPPALGGSRGFVRLHLHELNTCPSTAAADNGLPSGPPALIHAAANKTFRTAPLKLLAICLLCVSELVYGASASSISHQDQSGTALPDLEKRKSIPHRITHKLSQSTNPATIVLIPVLVLASGLFAGLTIGYMSLDSTQLAVLAKSGTPAQQTLARKIAPLRAKGHMLLITLLIANMIANETLPIVTEKALGGGIQAIIISTALVIVFSEIIPQTVCATYALRIGAVCAKPVQVLIFLFYPIVWPISRLLTKLIGEHSGVIYRPAELKELVNLHARKSERGGDLAEDVVTIMGSAIDLQERVVEASMTALNQCFMLNIDTQLNYTTMSAILTSGHSRIPVYENTITPTGAGRRIVGALLTKQLILIDPEDGILLREFPLNPLPHVASDMPLLNILNSFQEGRSHLAVVCPPANSLAHVELDSPSMERPRSPSKCTKNRWWWPVWKRKQAPPSPDMSPKHPTEAFTLMSAIQPSRTLLTDQPMGIISLEDVLEALLGEPIYDETDLDEHGHMAVPPYVPPEAVFALRQDTSLTAPSPVYDTKASSYLATGSEHGHSSHGTSVGSKAAGAHSLRASEYHHTRVRASSIRSDLSVESVPTRTIACKGATRTTSLFVPEQTTILPGSMRIAEVVDVHVANRKVDLHRVFTSPTRRSSWIRQQKRSAPLNVPHPFFSLAVDNASPCSGTCPPPIQYEEKKCELLGNPVTLAEFPSGDSSIEPIPPPPTSSDPARVDDVDTLLQHSPPHP
ncbi:hypothetical protein PCANC_25526 [Puccinia coronata f. sp. avenae]|uniref:CNNM transmembrane domain-containing protein n=1 Tax=Puccinia coronata f. sp. avenae TaxID=200324 RepID=A0A2N5TAB8_9BASI|nr:hypothetical protein PCANC_25526 [Puccinia coronata f. sp. avenae]